MYLHLGNQNIVRTGSISMILDMDTSTVSRVTRDYLAAAQKRNQVRTTTDEVPKSVVILRDGTVYLSLLSSSVLKKRTEEFSGM